MDDYGDYDDLPAWPYLLLFAAFGVGTAFFLAWLFFNCFTFIQGVLK